MSEQDLRNTLLSAEAQALSMRTVLDKLRAGRLTDVLELLEQSLDAAVLAIDNLSCKLGSADQERVAETLRVVSEYRQRHPRATAAPTGSGDRPPLPSAQPPAHEALSGRF